mgnify:CR=1 FL=1
MIITAIMAITFVQWRNVVSVNFTTTIPQKDKIKILTFNTHIFNNQNDNGFEKIAKFIKECDADIVCLQEFGHYHRYGASKQEILKFFDSIYPYRHIWFKNQNKWGENGLATFSRYPIVKKKKIEYQSADNISIYSDIIIEGDTIRVINNHLESNKLNKEDRQFAEKLIDENNNNKYDPESERIAFIDSLVLPLNRVADTLPELMKYDMKDTLNCLARKTEYELNIFREKPSMQMIVTKERVGDRTAYVTFMAPYAQVDSVWIKGVPQEKLITQFNILQDSLEIWVNDPAPQPDTLHLNVKYMKTDTLGLLNSFVEEIKLANPKKSAAVKTSKKNIKHEDTIAVYKVTAEPETVEQNGFVFEFKYPVVETAFDSLKFRYLNPKQQEFNETFTVVQDSMNLRKYILRPDKEMLPGYEYFLKVPHRRFKDINGFYNDSTEVKVVLPNDDKLSTMSLTLSNVENKYIVDLLNEKRDKILRQYIIEEDSVLDFPYLKAGMYSIRITEDLNRNNLVDTGNLLEHKQPEKVRFYKLEDGTFLIDIPEMTELEQSIDIKEMFR